MRPFSRVRNWLAGVVALVTLAGCASSPPPAPPQPPVAGDSPQQITERGYRLAPVYKFVAEGRLYAYARANSGSADFGLVFIDTQLACSTNAPPEELMEWAWVDQPDGLSYLASRLRQACGLEAATPARSPFAVESTAVAGSEPPQTDTDAQDGADGPRAGGTFGRDMANVAKQGAEVAGTLLVGMAALVFAWPVILATGAVVTAADSAADARGKETEAHAYEITLPAAAEGVRQALGTPAVEFHLPSVDTTVLGYSVDTTHALYVGVSDGQAVWIHGPDQWLKLLEQDAKDQQARGK